MNTTAASDPSRAMARFVSSAGSGVGLPPAICHSAFATSTQRVRPLSASACASAAVIAVSELSDTVSPNASSARSQRDVCERYMRHCGSSRQAYICAISAAYGPLPLLCTCCWVSSSSATATLALAASPTVKPVPVPSVAETEPSASSAASSTVATVNDTDVKSAGIVTVRAPSADASATSPVCPTVTVTARSEAGAGSAVSVKPAAVPSLTASPAAIVTTGSAGVCVPPLSICCSASATSTQRVQPLSANACASAAVIAVSDASATVSPNASSARSQRSVCSFKCAHCGSLRHSFICAISAWNRCATCCGAASRVTVTV